MIYIVRNGEKIPIATGNPNYKNGNSDNKWDQSLIWEADDYGYILINLTGLGSFEVKIDNFTIIKKVVGELDPDAEVLFSQIYPIKKGNKVELIADYPENHKCFFISY